MERKALLVHIKSKCSCGYISAMDPCVFPCLPFSASTDPPHPGGFGSACCCHEMALEFQGLLF